MQNGPAPVRLPKTPFVLAVAVAVLLVVSAPFVGQIRGQIRRSFPGQFVPIVGGIIAAGLIAALASAAPQIRERRTLRYGGILLSLAIAAGYAFIDAGDNPESNVVELFHFLQYGLISFLFYRAWRPLGDVSIFLLPLLAALIVGTAEEWLQWFIPNRVGEMKDILLNLVAISTGLLFSASVQPPVHWVPSLTATSRAGVARMTAAAVVCFSAFVHVVHAGHDITDPEIGTFDSRWSGPELFATQAETRSRWIASPPSVTLVRLSREDQYLTEGIQHVRERNELWSRGDVRGAWLENRILEKYFEPVLDTPTHEGSGHRWPGEQRADAQARAATQSAAMRYVSAAYPYRLFKWSKTLFWTVVGLITGGLLLWSRHSGAPSVPETSRLPQQIRR